MEQVDNSKENLGVVMEITFEIGEQPLLECKVIPASSRTHTVTALKAVFRVGNGNCLRMMGAQLTGKPESDAG